MAASGCGIVFSPTHRNDRSITLRRTHSLNSRSKHHTTTKRSPVTAVQGRDMAYSHGHSRSLSDKMRNLHRKKNSNESAVDEKPLPAVLPTSASKKNPKHLDLMEAASMNGREAAELQGPSRSHAGGHKEIGTGKENVDQRQELSRPALLNMANSYRKIAYDEYLSQKFGLEGGNKPKPAAVQRLRPGITQETRPGSDMSALSADSMVVNFHVDNNEIPAAPSAKDRRPKIQVTIPDSTGRALSTKRPRSTAHLAHQLNRQKTRGRSREGLSQVTPLTPTTNEAPARMSVVSPLSAVEMPRPRRPFSAFSLEEMTNDVPGDVLPVPQPDKSASSDSSDTGDQDDRSSNYSRRSSMSSLSEETTVVKKSHNRSHSMAFSIMSPAAAGVFDVMPLIPNRNHNKLRASKSTASLGVDMNKPLPPEPAITIVEPLSFSASSRLCGLQGKRKAPSPLTISQSSRSSMIESSGLPSRMSSLRSKYTPTNLDALDEAFARTSPKVQTGFYTHVEPSLSQAQLELEAHLHTINEEPGYVANNIDFAHDPLQISRGPNTMVPSRQAPPPPSSIKISDGSINSRKRLEKKPSTHVALQMRSDPSRTSLDTDTGLRRHISASLRGASAVKANRILGKDDNSSAAMERQPSAESNWSSSGSPQMSYDSSSPTMSREDSTTPETDISSIHDPAFEEVRARLELLSPKNDSHYQNSFHSNHKSGSSSPIKLPLQEPSKDVVSEIRSRPATPAMVEEADAKKETTPSIHITPDEEVQHSPLENEVTSEQLSHDDALVKPLQRRGRMLDETPPKSIASTIARPRSLASIAMSEIPDLYASLPSPGLTIRTFEMELEDEGKPMTAEEVERQISADAAEKVLLRILQNLDNLQDLFATATVSRGFYRTFKRHELPLMKNALYGMSPAAWELREMSPPYPGLEGDGKTGPKLDYTPALYLQHYMRDMYTMIALKSMILIHCESFLRADTITALAGGETERASQIDDAFWRVWTFCQLFGCGSNREEDIVAQMDWLRGGVLAAQQRRNANKGDLGSGVHRSSVLYHSPTSFGRGNAGGLSAEDLYDMTEIWTCLGVLVRGFQGKRQEARDYGIYQNADITAGDIKQEDSVLEEWTYHLLTLAPPTVLDVTSPTSPTAATFAHARSRGYTKWTPPAASRATFLKEAVSRVYQEKVAARHSPTLPSSPPKVTISSVTEEVAPNSASELMAARWRVARHAAEIRAKRLDPSFKALLPSEDRPMSEFPAVIEKLDKVNVPPLPGSGTHSRTPSETDTSKNFVSALVVPAGPQVKDPVDVAVERFVAMGFDKNKAAKALAETDTGNSIDAAAAMEWLVRERKRDVGSLMHATYRGPINATRDESPAPVSPENAIMEAVGLGLNIGGGNGFA